MVYKFQTSLNIEEFKNILRHRARSKNIGIAINHDRLTLNHCKIRMSSIDYHVPLITKIANEANKTTVKGYISLPKVVHISILAAYLIFAGGVFAIKNTETSIMIPLIVLFITALCIIGFIRIVLYPFYKYLLHNCEVRKLFESIENDFPVEAS